MRIFLSILVLIFSLQSWTKADGIRDFEIEGMSIGDSLLDYYSEEKVINTYKHYYPKSKKFIMIDGSFDKHLEITTGTSFSGNCHGPKLLTQFVIIAGKLKVFIHALTIKSELALLAAYGEFGKNLESSVKDLSRLCCSEPYTSSVEI